ncbi:polyhydroxyalkanoate synthesis repressor PhaR [Pararhodospirillum photometricum]|uniref:Polyhydroxyalkanoate synthesis repressor PhaR n=1 Tax=Pararhodospirillum photometricum DSM 122 TaxID=1150469 RepID=H6SIX4_PARPM|nr:polyhydroxyalkanoate synthesis repressor PhaR [Pararhodospirillum photometricum]CCG07939.1 Polyhydroxyalkanoate synthesis repressor PhaR [Pararhodospirillum photometricum DSM 122]
MPSKGSKSAGAEAPITIKKYANRRLYNTATSSYVTLDYLSGMVRENKDFVVYDAKTGEDITRSVLTQIIVEEEAKGQNLLPIGFLRQLISFYGDSLGGVVPQYLEYTMQSFSRNEEQMRSMMKSALDGLFPFQNFEEMNKRNLSFFENALTSFFNPFQTTGDAAAPPSPASPPRDAEALRQELEALQQQLARLTENEKKAPPADAS